MVIAHHFLSTVWVRDTWNSHPPRLSNSVGCVCCYVLLRALSIWSHYALSAQPRGRYSYHHLQIRTVSFTQGWASCPGLQVRKRQLGTHMSLENKTQLPQISEMLWEFEMSTIQCFPWCPLCTTALSISGCCHHQQQHYHRCRSGV